MKAEIRWTHFSGAYKEQIVKRLEESVSAYAFGETATEKGEKACVHSFSFGYRSPLNETAGLALEAENTAGEQPVALTAKVSQYSLAPRA